jgi:hypothetical protein
MITAGNVRNHLLQARLEVYARQRSKPQLTWLSWILSNKLHTVEVHPGCMLLPPASSTARQFSGGNAGKPTALSPVGTERDALPGDHAKHSIPLAQGPHGASSSPSPTPLLSLHGHSPRQTGARKIGAEDEEQAVRPVPSVQSQKSHRRRRPSC